MAISLTAVFFVTTLLFCCYCRCCPIIATTWLAGSLTNCLACQPQQKRHMPSRASHARDYLEITETAVAAPAPAQQRALKYSQAKSKAK